MATNRRKIMRNRRQSDLSEYVRHYFLTGERDQTLDGSSDSEWLTLCDKGKLPELWELHREALLSEWIAENPCARPWYWWRHDAPRELVTGCDGSEYFAYQAHRRRIGGTGTPAHEALAVVPHFNYGLPDSWLDEWPVDPSRGVPIDPADPPTLESQAVYLDRHGLLTADEKRHLKKHPELLEPEAVILEDDDIEEDEPAPVRLPEPVSGAGPYQTIDPK